MQREGRGGVSGRHADPDLITETDRQTLEQDGQAGRQNGGLAVCADVERAGSGCRESADL